VVNLLTEIGVKPDYYLGHSLGETAAAYAAAGHGDPVASERTCILCAYARGCEPLAEPLPPTASREHSNA
jgi:malonyl CoA-acyl carrier protein transacylase